MILWTRREIYVLALLATIPTLLYQFGFHVLAISWVPVGLLGTAVSLIVGFKNNASYGRLWEARQIYGGIVNQSRAFAVMVRDFIREPNDEERASILASVFHRHFAWLTALRHQLREPRSWENMKMASNVEYAKKFRVEEYEVTLADALKAVLTPEELTAVLSKKNRASQIMALQSKHLSQLHKVGRFSEFEFIQLQTAISGFYEHQGKAERIKNFPYPRSFSSVSTILLRLFVALVPYGLLNDFQKLGQGTALEGYTVLFTIPFATLLTWVFIGLDRVGESVVNPFEGGANDIPITNISRTIEIDMREMLDEKSIPAATVAINNILM
jgi:ion channel-forming bestrophin family protein